MAGLIFLQRVGKAMARYGLNALAGGLPLGDVVIETASAIVERWKQDASPGERRAELEAVAQASDAQVREQASAIVREVAGDQPREVQAALEGYLLQVPAALRQSLRRPADPGGTTVARGLLLERVEDVAPLLPAALPRFKSGDRPPGLGDWELVELLGVGGFGEVWKAKNPYLSEPVALKFCLDPDSARVLRNEAEMLSRVMRDGKHPGIVQLLDTYLTVDPPCLKYEYVPGGNLAGVVADRRASGQLPQPSEVLHLLLQLSEIIGFAHARGIVHRDLKPANILLESRENHRRAQPDYSLKVADFGIGAVASKQALREGTQTRTAAGATVARGAFTPLYASPEQMAGKPSDPRDDVYALGVIWYQLLTGDLTAGAPSGLRWTESLRQRGMSAEQIACLTSCIEARADHRPVDAGTLAARLRFLLAHDELPEASPIEDQPVRTRKGRATRVQTEEDEVRQPRPSRSSAWVGGALVLGLIAFVLVSLTFLGVSSREPLSGDLAEEPMRSRTTTDGHPKSPDESHQHDDPPKQPVEPKPKEPRPKKPEPPKPERIESFAQRVLIPERDNSQIQRLFFSDGEVTLAGLVTHNGAGKNHFERYNLQSATLLDPMSIKTSTLQSTLLAWSPDGSRLAVGPPLENQISVLSVPDSKLVKSLQVNPEKGGLAAKPVLLGFLDQDHLVVVNSKARMSLWQISTGTPVYEDFKLDEGNRLLQGFPAPWGVILSPDNRLLVIEDKGSFRVYDTKTPALAHTLPPLSLPSGKLHKVGGMVFNADKTELLVQMNISTNALPVANAKILARYNLREQTLLGTVTIAESSQPRVSISGDDRLRWWGKNHAIVQGNNDTKADLHDLASGKLLAHLETNVVGGYLPLASPDARLWYVASASGIGSQRYLTAVELPEEAVRKLNPAGENFKPPKWTLTPEGIMQETPFP